MTPWQKRARLVLARVAIGVIASSPTPCGRAKSRRRRSRSSASIPTVDRRDRRRRCHPVKGGDAGHPRRVQEPDHQQGRRDQASRRQDHRRQPRGPQLHRHRQGSVRRPAEQLVRRARRRQARDQRRPDRAPASRPPTSTPRRSCACPAPVKFKRGRMSGSGVGFTYDEQRDTMWILDKADVKFAAEGNAGADGLHRRRVRLRAPRSLHALRADAAHGSRRPADRRRPNRTVRLFPDRDEPDYLELRGGSKVTGGPNDKRAAARCPRATSTSTTPTTAARCRTRRSPATPRSSWRRSRAATGQQLAGEFMDIGLEPDGSVRSLSTRDASPSTLPATKDTAARTIRSTALAAAGNAQGLDQMKFSEGVEYREAATKTQGARIAQGARRSRRSSTRRPARCRRRASPATSISPTARCARSATTRPTTSTAGTLALTGKEITPEISDESLTLLRRSDRRHARSAQDGREGQRAQHAAAAEEAGRQRARRPSGPALLGDKEPVNILSDDADLRRSRARRPSTPGRRGCSRAHTIDQRRQADARRDQRRPHRDRQGGHQPADREQAGRAAAQAEADDRPRRDASPTPTRRAWRPTRPARSSTASRAT